MINDNMRDDLDYQYHVLKLVVEHKKDLHKLIKLKSKLLTLSSKVNEYDEADMITCADTNDFEDDQASEV
jgi:hypothetical protein